MFKKIKKLWQDLLTKLTTSKQDLQKDTQEVQSEDLIPDFSSVENRVFFQNGNDVYIGKEKVTEQVRGILRDEARNYEKTMLYEILNASVINESYHLALIQSIEFDQVRFAKAMKHWSHFMRNVINSLSK